MAVFPVAAHRHDRPMRTQTMPLAIMAAYASDLEAALALAVLLPALSTGVLILTRSALRSPAVS